MRLALIALLVPDYDEALRFFVEGLGWTCTADIDQGRKRWVTVRPPGGGADVLLARAAGEQARGIGDQFAGRVGLFLHTDDFTRDSARIRTAGGTFAEDPRMEGYGTVAVWTDPCGNRWDLIEPA
ncbi:VOC family protein [Jannaschia sp. LMIT008]|uniref:VOC family protein n=1 Tax=Jannaschia maritima TaxID=3032585 RepID=UPI002810A78B|nr:VOC family protein [Jannaschia sp. LMIT008]